MRDVETEPSQLIFAGDGSAVLKDCSISDILAGGTCLAGEAGTDEIHLILTPFTHADVAPLPRVQEPALPVVEMPEIAIQTEAPRSAPAAVSASAVLAPRLDPAHPNPLPGAAEIEVGNTAAVAMVLKIMVLPDGSVNEAVVVKSSGKPDIDLAVIAFVKAQWRFLPALLDGTAIQYWTTVSLQTG